jgi:hypothetical protein
VLFLQLQALLFDLRHPHIGVTGDELEKYNCVVTITDKNGKTYGTSVKEWWR